MWFAAAICSKYYVCYRGFFGRRIPTVRLFAPVDLSKTYVDTGALLTVHSTSEQIRSQAGEFAAALPMKGDAKLPPPQHPRYFQLSINPRVAT